MGVLQSLRVEMRDKCYELAEKLAVRGAVVASTGFSRAFYDDGNDVNVTVSRESFGVTRISAEGTDVLFVEFGAGARYGYGHPQAGEFGYGPGTYNPESPNWSSEHGWWYTGDDGKSHHTYGNPPAMAMYQAAKEIKLNLPEVAREVFNG